MTDMRKRDSSGRIVLRYSPVSKFQLCHRAYFWSEVQGLEPEYISRDDPRTWGTAVHEGLRCAWGNEPDQILPVIDDQFPDREDNIEAFEGWAKAHAAMSGYLRRWANARDVDVAPGFLIAVESEFAGPLMDHERESEIFSVEGRIDGAWFVDATTRRAFWGDQEVSTGVYLVEHKTASTIDAQYIAKIWADFQTGFYSEQVERAMGEPVAGVLYDVVGKTRTRHKLPETQAGFEERRESMRVDALAGRLGRRLKLKKSETEEQLFTRRVAAGMAEVEKLERDRGETSAEYLARLDAHYTKHDAFARISATADRARRLAIMDNLVDIATEIDFCAHTGRWPQTPAACHLPGRTCDFWAICSSGDDPRVIEQNYRLKREHHGQRSEPETMGEGPESGGAAG